MSQLVIPVLSPFKEVRHYHYNIVQRWPFMSTSTQVPTFMLPVAECLVVGFTTNTGKGSRDILETFIK